MSASDKSKLDGIASGATKITVDSAMSSSSTNPVQNKVIQAALDGKSPISHTHYYAGSSSIGGAATSANKLNTNAGDSNTPVYFSNGVPVACTSLDLNTTGSSASCTGNAATATYVKDSYNGFNISVTYAKSGQSSTSWLASWNGYELGSISPSILSVNYANSSGTASSASKATYIGDSTMNVYAEQSNEVNFGGTNGSDVIYFGYRARDNKSIPSTFIFGGGSGSANLRAKALRVGTNDIYITGSNKVLWSGAMLMNASQTAILSEPVSAQANGIVLVFCGYNPNEGSLQPYNWSHFYIPKEDISYNGTTGHTFFMMFNMFSRVAFKYIYIGDTRVTGNDNNVKSGASSGISFSNSWFVMRHIIGV